MKLSDDVDLDLQRLVTTRMLLQANSGGGKSWALRRILEQSHGEVQQIVIDVEDEFYTLREKFDYILVRKEGGDCVPEVRSAALCWRIGCWSLAFPRSFPFTK
jgi:DNA helicase HerA-like ATPase